MKSTIVRLLALLLVLALPNLAFAQDNAARAAELKKQGDDAMLDLRYADALAAYDQAYALDPQPALHYNRGRSLQALNRYPEALDALETFERQAPADLKARVPKLGELVAEVRAQVTTLSITSNVSGASVLVRDQRIGTTPLTGARANAGDAVIEVTADGYKPFKKSVKLPGGATFELKAALEPKSAIGVVAVTSPQAGASVLIDGEPLGVVPAEKSVPAGEHQVLVTLDGYEDAETTVVVKAGDRQKVDVPLREAAGIYERWWFWTGIGVVVVGGVALTAALLTERPADEGDISPGQVAVGTVSIGGTF